MSTMTEVKMLELFETLKKGQEMITNKLDMNTSKLQQLDDHVTMEMEKVRDRLTRLEMPEYDPERTVILTGLRPHESKTDREVILELMSKVGIDWECEIRNVKRLESYNTKPGLVKCELATVEQKVKILRAKTKLKEVAPTIWIRSSKPHVERILEQNMKAILSIIAEKLDPNSFRLTAHGKLIEKEYRDGDRADRDRADRDRVDRDRADRADMDNDYPKLPNQAGLNSQNQEESDPYYQQRSQDWGRGHRGNRNDSRGPQWQRGGRGNKRYRGFQGQRGRNYQYQTQHTMPNNGPAGKRERPPSMDSPQRDGPKQPSAHSSPIARDNARDLFPSGEDKGACGGAVDEVLDLEERKST